MRRARRRLRTPAQRVGTLPNADIPPPQAAPVDEEQLLARAFRDRDERAFRRVLERYFSPMLRLARVYVGSRAEAEDVVQETWLAALRGIPGFRGAASLRTWLFRILRNRARTHGKRSARQVPFSQLKAADSAREVDPGSLLHSAGDLAFPTHAAGAATRSPEEHVLGRELRAEIEAAIARLPARQREVIVLRDVEGWSAEEVCALLRLSPENQRVLLHRARGRVRENLRPYLAEVPGPAPGRMFATAVA